MTSCHSPTGFISPTKLGCGVSNGMLRGEALYGWVRQRSNDERHQRRAAPQPSAGRRSPRDSASRGRHRRQRLHRHLTIRAKTGSDSPQWKAGSGITSGNSKLEAAGVARARAPAARAPAARAPAARAPVARAPVARAPVARVQFPWQGLLRHVGRFQFLLT
jgi:hypothetical protein